MVGNIASIDGERLNEVRLTGDGSCGVKSIKVILFVQTDNCCGVFTWYRWVVIIDKVPDMPDRKKSFDLSSRDKLFGASSYRGDRSVWYGLTNVF